MYPELTSQQIEQVVTELKAVITIEVPVPALSK
jgi:hypothetical protein